MTKIGNVPEIKMVIEKLAFLEQGGLVRKWELPYENLLTRLSAAIFFLTPADESRMKDIWDELSQFQDLKYEENKKKSLSGLQWQFQFVKEGAL